MISQKKIQKTNNKNKLLIIKEIGEKIKENKIKIITNQKQWQDKKLSKI